MTYISQLQQAIRVTHGCDSRHVSTTPVLELDDGHTIFDGSVETFQVANHPKSEICFAWGYEEDGKMKATAVLGIPPIISPALAVRAAVVAASLRRTARLSSTS